MKERNRVNGERKIQLDNERKKRVNGGRKIQLYKERKKNREWREKNTARQGKKEKERMEGEKYS